MNSFVVVVYLYRPIKPSSCMKAYYYQKCVEICNRGKICGRLFFIPQRPEAFPFRRRAFGVRECAKPWSCGLALIISFYCMDHHKKGLLSLAELQKWRGKLENHAVMPQSFMMMMIMGWGLLLACLFNNVMSDKTKKFDTFQTAS